jgi:hypothetical protein
MQAMRVDFYEEPLFCRLVLMTTRPIVKPNPCEHWLALDFCPKRAPRDENVVSTFSGDTYKLS